MEWLWERVGGEELEAVSSLEGFRGGSVGKESAYNAADVGSTPGSGRSPGGGNGNLSSILAWKIPVTEEPGGLHVVAKSRTCMTEMIEHTRTLLEGRYTMRCSPEETVTAREA